MSSTGSITHWIGLLRAGDQAAAQRLWESYFQQLAGLARKKLRGLPRRVADEEDVALSAFDSFCRGVERGRFPQLHDRHNLWGLLIVITARKAINLARFESRQKRGGTAPDESVPPGADLADSEQAVEDIVGREPSPEFALELAEDYQRLLERLGDTELQSVALWKMEGYTNEEIAAKLGCVARTVERKLQAIRGIWSHEGVTR